jgi:hypothetical protein
MSGSIGGKRIKRAEVQPTLDNYIEKVLKGFPGFVSAQITGSYNAGTRADHGDIDIAVHIKGNDVKTVKKNFKAYLDSLSDDLTPKFVFGKNEGKKAQLYGAIVTCGFPINGRPEDYVQIDNIIVTNENEQRFQREFLDLDAAKQGLIMGLIRVILHHKDPNKILEYIGLVDLPKLSGNQEYEFVLSSAGLSFRRVTLNNDMKEVSRDEIWRSANWDIVEYILSDFNLKQSYEELLEQVAKMVKNNERSRRRIVGIMKSMIKVGPGEVGTPKGIGKENAIKLAAETLNVFESLTLSEMLNNSNLTDLMEYILESEEVDPKKLVLDYVKKIPYDKRKWQDSGVSKDKYEKFCNTGKNVWFDNPKSMIKFIKDNWNRFKKWFGLDENKMETIIDNAYSIINRKTNTTVPFVISYGNTIGIFIRNDIDYSQNIFSMIENELEGLPHNKWNFGTGFGTRAIKGEGFEKLFKNRLKQVLLKSEGDVAVKDTLVEEVISKLNLPDNCDPNEIIIKSQGKKNTKRKIFDPNLSFNSSIDCGKEIADIIISYKDKTIYLSLKDGNSQTSGPACNDILRTGFKNYKSGKNLEYYYSFCKLLGLEPDEFYKWYHNNEFKHGLTINPDNNRLAKFVSLIIGGGYTYVNSNGHVIDIPNNYELNVKFTNLKKGKPKSGNEIKTLYIEGYINNEISCNIVFRSSDSKGYPYRFTIQSKELDKIYELISK